jgi:hypothetical protein
MPFVTSGSRRIGRIVAATLGLAFVITGSASAAEPKPAPPVKNAASNPNGCVVDHALSTPFTAWADWADYALAPGGDFESGAIGWTLTKNAGLAQDNQPYRIGASAGATSLELPAGSTATSAPMCIDSSYPFFRLFARKLGTGKAGLRVNVLFLDNKGNLKGTMSGDVRAASNDWSLTDSLKIGVTFDPSLADGAAPVAFQFIAPKDNTWRIDDLYVDPYARR